MLDFKNSSKVESSKFKSTIFRCLERIFRDKMGQIQTKIGKISLLSFFEVLSEILERFEDLAERIVEFSAQKNFAK